MKMITLTLTCPNEEEANRIIEALLANKLAACVKTIKVGSNYYWKTKREFAEEVMLLIETSEQKFEEIEAAVRKIHSYETFTLMSYEVAKTSKGVEDWINMETATGENMDLKKAKLYTDGGSRGNPGPSACAFVICNMDDNVVEKSGSYLGTITNNQAEYKGLIEGVERVGALGIKDIDIYMDSELIVNQITGKYKVKNVDLKPYFLKAKNLLDNFDNFSITHVPRAMNSIADSEVNRILDERKV